MSNECPKCQTNNPQDSKFCKECATPLTDLGAVYISQTRTLQTPSERLIRGTRFVDRYEIIEKLGEGGMGAVYRVEDTKVGEEVALKLINPLVASDKKTIERFRNELKFARKIRHKHVCQMFDLGEDEGTHFITMEYVAGEDLKSLLRRTGKLTIEMAVRVAKQVADGLAEAHRIGIVHRDLKPSNIMIDKEGHARIMDFGIAQSKETKGITGAGLVIGTPEYMSPEQAEAKEVDQRSDIYSLGVMLYEMTTGRLPFEGDTPLALAMKHKGEKAKNPKEINPQIPDDLSGLILKCLEKEKEIRYQSADEIRSELVNIEQGIPTTERIVPKRKPITSKEITVTIGFKRLVIPTLVIMAIVVTALIIWSPWAQNELVPTTKEKPSIAVLPFVDLSPQKDQEHLCDGMTSAIITKLSGLQGWKVMNTASVMRLKNTEKDVKQIGQELDVATILLGSVRKEADDLRVDVQLVNAENGFQLWSETYEQKLERVFTIQSDVAQKIAQALKVKLTPEEKDRIQEKLTENTEAYDLYLRGNGYFNRSFTEKDFRIALQMYEKAVELDPIFTHAYSMLSIIHSRMYFYYYDRTEKCLIKAKEAAEKALQIKPESPEAQMALGYYYYFGHLEYEKALEQFETALKLQPDNIELLGAIGFVKRRQGKLEQALIYLKRAYDLDPLSARFARHIGLTYKSMNQFDQAENYYDRAIAISPDIPSPYSDKAWLYIYRDGDIKKAKKILEDSSQKYGFEFNWKLAELDVLEGEYKDALDRLSRATSEFVDGQDKFITKAQRYAQIYGYINETELEQKYYEIARKISETRIQERPEDERFHAALGLVYAGQGRKEDAIREGVLATELLPVTKMTYGSGLERVRDLARIYVMVGEHESAIDQIEFLYSLPGTKSIHIFRLDPIWKPLWDSQRFKKIVNEKTKIKRN